MDWLVEFCRFFPNFPFFPPKYLKILKQDQIYIMATQFRCMRYPFLALDVTTKRENIPCSARQVGRNI